MNNTSSLCKHCKHKFRRVFIPLKPEQYVDENGEPIFNDEEDNVIIMNICLITAMDIDGESTVECDHFMPKENEGVFKFFNQLDLN